MREKFNLRPKKAVGYVLIANMPSRTLPAQKQLGRQPVVIFINFYLYLLRPRPDMTPAVDWALKANYLSIFPSASPYVVCLLALLYRYLMDPCTGQESLQTARLPNVWVNYSYEWIRRATRTFIFVEYHFFFLLLPMRLFAPSKWPNLLHLTYVDVGPRI